MKVAPCNVQATCLCCARKVQKNSDEPIGATTMLAAQAHFQHKQYDSCLLTLHTLSHVAGADNSEAEALTAICKIHKHAAMQEWHKVGHLDVPSVVQLLLLHCTSPVSHLAMLGKLISGLNQESIAGPAVSATITLYTIT